MADSPVSFEQMLGELAGRHKLDLRGYKFTTLRRRTRRRMEHLRLTDHASYVKFVDENPGEVTELLYTVLINVTKFFRDAAAWQVIRQEVLPMLLQEHRPGETFKVWCAGCSTGEEAYSISLMIADYLGPQLKDHDIKVYATDYDEQALQVARKGEYSIDKLSNIPEEYRHLLDINGSTFRPSRDVRRMTIFGRSNIVADAPISHVNLSICRNLLIYFEPSAQRLIMNRLRYAVDPGGVLFLGKSESQLRSSPQFIPLESRWRIFQRTNVPSPLERPKQMNTPNDERNYLNERAQQELAVLKAYHEAVIDTLDPGIVILDADDNVVRENDSARRLWQSETMMLGSKIGETSLMRKCPDLKGHLDSARGPSAKPVSFNCNTPDAKELNVVIRPITAEAGTSVIGTLIYMEDRSPHEDLQHTVEELQTTVEELQSTNEELETTNEELQSTNEDLETTNEELQSTNEELETTNEELKSLNDELEDINDELAKRSRELDEANARYSEMVERMPWPMFMTNSDGAVKIYNSSAQRLFGFATPANDGMKLREVPMSVENHTQIVGHLDNANSRKQNLTVDGFKLSTNVGSHNVRLHIKPMYSGNRHDGALVMFEPVSGAGVDGADGVNGRRSSLSKKAAPRNGSSQKSLRTNGKAPAKKNAVTKKLKRR